MLSVNSTDRQIKHTSVMKKSNECWWTCVNQGSKTSPKWEGIGVILLSVLLVQKKRKNSHFMVSLYKALLQFLRATTIRETVFPASDNYLRNRFPWLMVLDKLFEVFEGFIVSVFKSIMFWFSKRFWWLSNYLFFGFAFFFLTNYW